MDPSLDTPLLHVVLSLFYGGAACFAIGSVLPRPTNCILRGVGAGIGVLGSLLSLILLGKLIALLGEAAGALGIATLIAFQYRNANRNAVPASARKRPGATWFLIGKNGLFFGLGTGLFIVVCHELDRKLAITSDWDLRIALMKGALTLFCSGLFGIFAEPISASSNWEKWPFRLNSTTFLLIGGWAIFAIRPTEIPDEVYDGLAFLVLLFQAAIGINLLATMKGFQSQLGSENGESASELGMNELKF